MANSYSEPAIGAHTSPMTTIQYSDISYAQVVKYILIFLIVVFVVYTFFGGTAAVWVLGLILLGMVFNNWDAIDSTWKGLIS